MAESVYKIIEIVGTSPTSWGRRRAPRWSVPRILRDLRIAEVSAQDVVINDGKVEAYRVRLKPRSSTKISLDPPESLLAAAVAAGAPSAPAWSRSVRGSALRCWENGAG